MIIIFDLLFLYSISFMISWIYDELEKELKRNEKRKKAKFRKTKNR